MFDKRSGRDTQKCALHIHSVTLECRGIIRRRVGPVMILIGILPETEEIDISARGLMNLIGGEGFGGVELVLTGGIHRCAACPARDAIGHE